MKKKLLVFLLSIGLFANLKAEFGIWASAVSLSANNVTQFYNTNPYTPNPVAIGPVNFTGNLGSFGINSGQLLLKGGEVKTFKNNGGNVCGGSIFYTVYPVGNRPATPVFTPITLNFLCNCSGGTFNSCGGGTCTNGSDQKWQNVNNNVDLTAFASGNYTLEVYYDISGESTSGGCSQLRTDNNGGTNFTANFNLYSVTSSLNTQLSIQNTQNGSNIFWNVKNDQEINTYQIFKTQDGITNKIADVASKKVNSSYTYKYFDVHDFSKEISYKIKAIKQDGSFYYTNTVLVKQNSLPTSAKIYASSKNTLTILGDFTVGNYSVSIININGQIIESKQCNLTNIYKNEIELMQVLKAGFYFAVLQKEGNIYKYKFSIL